jgi:hypothetical protein
MAAEQLDRYARSEQEIVLRGEAPVASFTRRVSGSTPLSVAVAWMVILAQSQDQRCHASE